LIRGPTFISALQTLQAVGATGCVVTGDGERHANRRSRAARVTKKENRAGRAE
jgi:hypothetical protein